MYSFTPSPKGVQNCLLQDYLTHRDQSSGRLTQETQIYYNMSLKAIPLFWRNNGIRSISIRSLPVRIIWDSNCHGGRLSKFASNIGEAVIAGQCPICRGRDSQRHWLMDCPNPGSIRLRRACTQVINGFFSDFGEKERPKYQKAYASAVPMIAYFFMDLLIRHPHGHRAAIGCFTASFVHSLRSSLGDIAQPQHFQRQDFRLALDTAIRRCCRYLGNTAYGLWL